MTRVYERRFDHEEAYARWRAGETLTAIAESCGVTLQAVSGAIARLDPQRRSRLNAYSRSYQRDHLRKPCIRGCGRLAWHHAGRSGVCQDCYAAEARAAAEARDNHGTETRYKLGCRCDKCRAGAAEGRRKRRKSIQNPTVHGLDWVYRNGCRCDACREAWKLKQRELRAARREVAA